MKQLPSLPLVPIRFLIVLAFTTAATLASAQNNWNVNGNATTNGNFLGTTNNEPLIFKTNSLEALRIKPNGEIKVSSFENIGKGVVTFNNNGVLTNRVFPNDTNEVFCGTGTFKSVAALSGWTRTGNVLYNSTGVNVGIGTNSPQVALDVVGSANFTGTVTAQGVFLSNKVLADTLKAASMFSLNNNLHMSGGNSNEIYTTTGNLKIQCNPNVYASSVIFAAGTGGNVGIGTFSPQAKLDVSGSTRLDGTINAPQMAGQGYGYVGCSPGGDFIFIPDPILDPGNPNFCSPSQFSWNLHGNANTDPQTDFVGTCDGSALVFRTDNIERMRLTGDGNLGIGTNSPGVLLQVNVNQSTSPGAPAASFNSTNTNSLSSVFIVPSLVTGGYNPLSQQGDFGIFWSDGAMPDGKNYQSGFVLAPWGNPENGLRITSNGDVGVGMSNPAYKLDVCGTVRAKEVRVNLTGCDFVFDSSYNLMSMDSLRQFVTREKHLPGIATAKQMETPNGVALGELNSQYLQKIEELTLYILILEERVAALEKK